MKPCELCKSPAKIYCDSDQASLCWTCDNKVHSANFLVARHSRTLLCRKCHSPTPWTAAGEKLGPSVVSICQKCVADDTSDDDDDDDRDESEEENNEDDDYDEDCETELHVRDDDHNQIVPLCYTPPPPASSSSSDDCSVGDTTVFVKRKRVNDEDIGECLSKRKKQRVVCAAGSSEASEGNKGTLYNFISLSSEGMGEKLNSNRHTGNVSGAVTCECTTTTSNGLDLNSSES